MTSIKLPTLASKQTCSGCLSCVDSCPVSALSTSIGEDGHFYPYINSDKCIGCLNCERTCPVVCGFEYNSNVERARPWKAWNKNDEERMRSTSGGVFSALARYTISQKGVVYGAVSRGIKVLHTRIDKYEDVEKLQGSKYLQSDTTGIYKAVQKDLRENKFVLFSGTGCQVAGLLSFLGRPFENLITMDLICAGVPSSFLMTRYCEEEKVIPEMYFGVQKKMDGYMVCN